MGSAPEGYFTHQKKELVVCIVDFFVIEGHLYKMGTDEILRRNVPEFKRVSILVKACEEVVGGHYASRETT